MGKIRKNYTASFKAKVALEAVKKKKIGGSDLHSSRNDSFEF